MHMCIKLTSTLGNRLIVSSDHVWCSTVLASPWPICGSSHRCTRPLLKESLKYADYCYRSVGICFHVSHSFKNCSVLGCCVVFCNFTILGFCGSLSKMLASLYCSHFLLLCFCVEWMTNMVLWLERTVMLFWVHAVTFCYNVLETLTVFFCSIQKHIWHRPKPKVFQNKYS